MCPGYAIRLREIGLGNVKQGRPACMFEMPVAGIRLPIEVNCDVATEIDASSQRDREPRIEFLSSRVKIAACSPCFRQSVTLLRTQPRLTRAHTVLTPKRPISGTGITVNTGRPTASPLLASG